MNHGKVSGLKVLALLGMCIADALVTDIVCLHYRVIVCDWEFDLTELKPDGAVER